MHDASTINHPFGVALRFVNFLRRLTKKVYVKTFRTFHTLPVVPLDTVAAPLPFVFHPILTDICLPPYHGKQYAHHDDLTPFLRIVNELQPKIIFEIGTAHGNLAANLCKLLPDAKVFTLNALAEQMTGEITTYALSREEIGRVYRAEGFSQRVVQIFANSAKVDLSETFSGRVVDLAILDGCHDTAFVINDFEKIRPFMRPGGTILFHDTHPSMAGHLEGSYLAAMKLRARGFDIKQIDLTWWGIWRASNEPVGK